MSTQYKTTKDVPIETLVKRLNELSVAITKGKDEALDEFTMRIPAECDRDADLVLAEAARRLETIKQLQQERDALAAHVDAARPMIEAYRSHLGGALCSLDDEERGYAEEAESWLS